MENSTGREAASDAAPPKPTAVQQLGELLTAQHGLILDDVIPERSHEILYTVLKYGSDRAAASQALYAKGASDINLFEASLFSRMLSALPSEVQASDEIQALRELRERESALLASSEPAPQAKPERPKPTAEPVTKSAYEPETGKQTRPAGAAQPKARRSPSSNRQAAPSASSTSPQTHVAPRPKRRPAEKPRQVRASEATASGRQGDMLQMQKLELQKLDRHLRSQGYDPLALLQPDWELQRTFWLVTNTDTLARDIYRAVGNSRRPTPLRVTTRAIIARLYEAAPDVLGPTPESSRPTDFNRATDQWEKRWVQGEQLQVIGQLGALAAAQEVELEDIFPESPQSLNILNTLLTPGVSVGDARELLGIPSKSMPSRVINIINTLVKKMHPSVDLRDQRLKARHLLAQSPLTLEAPTDARLLIERRRQTLRAMDIILTRQGENPPELLSNEVADIYLLLVDPNNTLEEVLKQSSLPYFSDLDRLTIPLVAALFNARPEILGFAPRKDPDEETLQDSLKQQPWRFGERPYFVAALAKALEPHRLAIETYLSPRQHEAWRHTVRFDEINMHIDRAALAADLLLQRINPGLIDISAVRRTAMKSRDQARLGGIRNSSAAPPDKTHVGARVADLLMDHYSLSADEVIRRFAEEFEMQPLALQRFFQGKTHPNATRMLQPLLRALGVDDDVWQEFMTAYRAEAEHDRRTVANRQRNRHKKNTK